MHIYHKCIRTCVYIIYIYHMYIHIHTYIYRMEEIVKGNHKASISEF